MIFSTRGIVLYQADYSETSMIVRIYTEQFGLQSFIVKGVRKKGSRIKRNLFGPLSLLDLVAYRKESGGLQLMKEVSCHRQLNAIASDIAKSSVVLFMNELLYRSISGEMPDKNLFGFVYDTVVQLEETTGSIAAFPLLFALKLAHFLGFEPHNNYSQENNIFDLLEGNFCKHLPDHPHYLTEPMSHQLAEVLPLLPGDPISMDFEARNALLEKTAEYYRLHIPALGELKSHHILNSVLRD